MHAVLEFNYIDKNEIAKIYCSWTTTSDIYDHDDNLYLYRTIWSFCIIQLDIAKIIIYIPKIKNYNDKQILDTPPPIKLSSICVNTNQIGNAPFGPEVYVICLVFVCTDTGYKQYCCGYLQRNRKKHELIDW
jgi:hypothetical protein